MKQKSHLTTGLLIGLWCCFIACIGDFLVTFYLGWIYKGYNWLQQSESLLGSSDSPVALYMNTWEAILCFLFIVFAYALRETIFSKGRWQILAVWLIVIYGLGEGIGSGVFPYDFAGGKLTISGKLHSLFSGLGEIAMVLLPFVLSKIFTRLQYPKLNGYSRLVAFSGPVFILLFLLARQGFLPLRGLWQRIFILDYYSLLMVFCLTLMRYPLELERAGSVRSGLRVFNTK